MDYKYAQDQYYQELKESENLRNRLDVLNTMSPYVGMYFSKQYVRTNILKLTEDEVKQIEKENEEDPVTIQPGMPGSEQVIPSPDADPGQQGGGSNSGNQTPPPTDQEAALAR